MTKEQGYLFFNKIIKSFGGNYNIIPFIMGRFMVYILFIKYGVKEKITIILIYSIYNLIFDIIQIRNTFCMLFILMGIEASQKKNIKYLIYNFFATSFHTIGIVYFLFYLTTKIKMKNYIFILVLSNIINILFLDFYIVILKKIFPMKAMYLKTDFNFGVFISNIIFTSRNF